MTVRTIQEFQLQLNPPLQLCPLQLSRHDRRFLLRANMRLLSYRIARGLPILESDVTRMIPYTDDAKDTGGERE
jgi:hypothetical protein